MGLEGRKVDIHDFDWNSPEHEQACKTYARFYVGFKAIYAAFIAISILFILFLLCSCASKRKTQIERKTDITLATLDGTVRRDSVARNAIALTRQAEAAKVVITEWSAPDSTGMQHKTKTTEVDYTCSTDKTVTAAEQKVSETVNVKSKDLKVKETEVIKEEVKKETHVIPWYAWLLLIAVGAFWAYIKL